MTERIHKEGVGGWLLIYLIGSIPVILFYSVGLSGWFLEYPAWLIFAFFLAFALPLALIPMKSPAAPKWNIVGLWAASILITLRMAYGVLFGGILADWPRLMLPRELAIIPGIAMFALGWATVWTKYFRKSVRVENTFSRKGNPPAPAYETRFGAEPSEAHEN